jgi:hypothetical protein
MKLYVAFIIYHYEGGTLLGAFDTREQANTALNNADVKGDDQAIYEVELNQEVAKWI